MNFSSLSVRSVLVALSAAFLALVGAALAAQPKPGDYAWCNYNEAGGFCQDALTFTVNDDQTAVKDLFISTYTCGAGEAKGSIKVNDRGKFKFDGKTRVTNLPLEVKGKFVSKKKAEGTFTIGECSKGEFTAKPDKGEEGGPS